MPIETLRRGLLLAPRFGFGAGLLLLAATIAYLMSAASTFRIALVASAVILIGGVWALRPTNVLYVILIWTVALGMLRRLVSYSLLGVSTSFDPLLIVAPIAFLLLAVTAFHTGALHPRTRLSQAVLILTVLIGLAAFSPLNGSLTAGLGGLIFFVPVLAFWVGRGLVDDRVLRRLLGLVAVLALPVMVYGFWQLISGFPPWDAAWISDHGYASLNVGGTLRQFASLSSAAEYAYVLASAVVIWSWMRPARVPRLVSLAIVAALVIALFYESSRGVMFALVGTTGLVFAASRGIRVRGAVVVAVAAVFLLPVIVSSVAPTQNSRAKGTGALVAHQVNGLADPTGANSTLSIHTTLVLDGIRSAFSNPLGQGISVVTNAAQKLGGTSQGTDADISNLSVALGLPGLALYLYIVWSAFRAAYGLAVRRRDALAYVALGLLGLTFLQWFNGALYAVAFLPWLVLGWVDRQSWELASEQLERPAEA